MHSNCRNFSAEDIAERQAQTSVLHPGEAVADVGIILPKHADAQSVADDGRDDVGQGVAELIAHRAVILQATIIIQALCGADLAFMKIAICQLRTRLMARHIKRQHLREGMLFIDEELSTGTQHAPNHCEQTGQIGQPAERADCDIHQIKSGIVALGKIIDAALGKFTGDSKPLRTGLRVPYRLITDIDAHATIHSHAPQRHQLDAVVATEVDHIFADNIQFLQRAELRFLLPDETGIGKLPVPYLVHCYTVMRHGGIPCLAVCFADIFVFHFSVPIDSIVCYIIKLIIRTLGWMST